MNISLPIPGGKFRIWEQLCAEFPQTGNKYVELFTGRGNIFFNFKQIAAYNHYHLNDQFTGKFLKAVQTVRISDLPLQVTDATFEEWRIKALSNNPVALVLEPVITFKGKGYNAGCGVNSSHSRYNHTVYIKKLAKMQQLLCGVTITSFDYCYVDLQGLTSDDFIYCDPPYIHTKGVGYPNINHHELIRLLKQTEAQWAISGYEDDSYIQELGEPTLRIERNLEMSNDSNQIIECLWTNY